MPPKKKRAKKKFRVKTVRGAFNLPIQTVTLIPSTTAKSKPITAKQLARRVAYARRQLSQFYGGYTSIKGTGGYPEGRRIIREKIVRIAAFAKRSDFKKNKSKWVSWTKDLATRWKQDSMGIIIENDLKYVAWKDRKMRVQRLRKTEKGKKYWKSIPL